MNNRMNIYLEMKALRIVLVFITLVVAGNFGIAQRTEDRNVGSFYAISAAEGIDVYVKPGTKEKVRVEASGIDVNDVLTDVGGGRLKIHLSGNRHRNHSVKVFVTFVKLEEISASSAANVISEGIIESKSLDLSVSSAADIELDINVGSVEAVASSAGDIELSGKADRIDASASSAGGVDAYDLEAKKVRARASSGADIKVHASEEIDAKASSGGSVRYRGNPQRSHTDSGSGGSVRKSH
ncbi:head GIN domain-containing protein [Fulvivirga sp. M361]|uniref:head GIN domain-containing protein n=1 Tax=Fulvivirga sp. M361 TaxID=2594266 RepID=UPI001624DE15|nr:head GIN domain-containing protein [Fulvivirga sp. M361]